MCNEHRRVGVKDETVSGVAQSRRRGRGMNTASDLHSAVMASEDSQVKTPELRTRILTLLGHYQKPVLESRGILAQDAVRQFTEDVNMILPVAQKLDFEPVLDAQRKRILSFLRSVLDATQFTNLPEIFRNQTDIGAEQNKEEHGKDSVRLDQEHATSEKPMSRRGRGKKSK